jgi:hypothetical protein
LAKEEISEKGACMKEKSGELADVTIKVFLFRWSTAVRAQFDRIRNRRVSPPNDSSHLSGEDWSDTALLLEAMSQFYRWLDIANERWPRIKTLRQPNEAFKKETLDLRKMMIHADDFLVGKGRGEANQRFVAKTPFGHCGTTVQWADNVLVVGGRLFIMDAAHDVICVAESLDNEDFLCDF